MTPSEASQIDPVETAFYNACKAHDLTFTYSDDHAVYRRGLSSWYKVQELAGQLPRATAVRIWNSVVDEKLLPDSRELFYWR